MECEYFEYWSYAPSESQNYSRELVVVSGKFAITS